MPMSEEQFEALQVFIFECIAYAVACAAAPTDRPRIQARTREFDEAVQTARDVLVTTEPGQ